MHFFSVVLRLPQPPHFGRVSGLGTPSFRSAQTRSSNFRHDATWLSDASIVDWRKKRKGRWASAPRCRSAVTMSTLFSFAGPKRGTMPARSSAFGSAPRFTSTSNSANALAFLSEPGS